MSPSGNTRKVTEREISDRIRSIDVEKFLIGNSEEFSS
jgi:hypothetical protein